MRTNHPHEIDHFDERETKKARDKTLAQLFSKERPDHIEISSRDAKMLKSLNSGERRGWMRNQPCPCGSGKKFKRCHW